MVGHLELNWQTLWVSGSPAPDEILERSLCQRRLFLQKGRRNCFQMHGIFKTIFSLILVYFCPKVPIISLNLLILQNQYHNLSIWTSVKLCLYHYNFATLNIRFVISSSAISAYLFREEIIFYNVAMKAFYFYPCLGLGVWGLKVIIIIFVYVSHQSEGARTHYSLCSSFDIIANKCKLTTEILASSCDPIYPYYW